MGYSGYSGYSGYPQLQNPRIRPAGKSPCEVARELRDPTPRPEDSEAPAADVTVTVPPKVP